jgi:phage/plasmid-associated DNA primase
MMKRIFFGLGETNSGKSILTKAVTLSCGDYVDSFNAENLAYRNSSQDEAQIMRWAMLLRWKRIIFSNEVKSTVELNGNMLKKVTSGGDSLIGRMHCGLETSFITHFLPVVLANDLPKIKPYDSAVSGRVRVVGYKKTFVDEPSNEFELKKDNNLDEELQTLRFQKCFVGILIWEYTLFIQNGRVEAEPDDVIAAKEEWIGQEANYIEKFLNDFEITDNKSDFVPSQQIEMWLTGYNLGVTMKKFGVDMAKECKIKGHANVRTDVKSFSGKKMRGWFGIKMLGVTGNG